jgi:hypothetical protein
MGVFSMKNHLTLGIISVLTVFVQSCAPSTSVRVLSLSYEGLLEAQSLSNPEKLTSRFNGPKRVDDEETYIFPGDILTFTVELEDPNYEFISLLSVKFNGVTIRANTNDSIVTTSDCGVNICVKFPFEVSANITEYKIEEVRFAKLNSESGVSAIIDNASNNKLILNNLWYSESYPNVTRSVNEINELLSSLEYKNIDDLISMFQETNEYKVIIQTLIKQRTLKVMNPSHDVIGDPNFGPSTRLINFPSALDSAITIPNSVGNENKTIQLIELFPGSDSEFVHYFYSDTAPIIDSDFEQYLGAYSPTFYFNLYFGMLDDSFSNVEAFNKGNDIYLLVNEEEVFLYRMGRDTYIISY